MDRFLVADDAEILVGRGMELRPPARPDRQRIMILTQPGVPREIAARVEQQCTDSTIDLVELPDRDDAKELSVVGDVYDRLASFNLGRHDTIVGVGGGAVTDVAGFIAATWLRGVESMLVPTTLLGAVDASIGGKTGINRQGKNLVGSFWHPSRVVVDLETLDALPTPLRLEGAAETVKAGLIRDPAIVHAYEAGGLDAPLDDVVGRAIAVKTAIVRSDFRESADRALLNFGHTIGHAVELLAPLPHGLAVSVGMVAAGLVSASRFGFDSAWLTNLLFTMGLPVAAAGISGSAALELVRRDKKRTSAGIRMVLLRDIGDPVIEVVAEAELVAALDAIGAV